MSSLRAWALRFSGLFGKERKERDLADELDSHLRFHIEDNLRAGMSPAEARRDALIMLGGLDQAKEKYRHRRSIPFLESLLQDLRFGIRMLRKNPQMTAIVILTLAIGIGANTAVFSVVNAILLKPLRAPKADQLVQFLTTSHGVSSSFTGPQEFNVWQQQTTTFEDVSAYRLELVNLTNEPLPEQIPVARVSADFFRLFGAPVLRGRVFGRDEDRPQGAKVAVLSYGFWQRHFGSETEAVGKAIILGSDHCVPQRLNCKAVLVLSGRS